MNTNNALLSSKELAICERVSLSNQAPHNRRAQALLALNEGLTQLQTSQLTGLTIGQVRYCLQRFRQFRTGIFPNDTHAQLDQDIPEAAEKLVEDTKSKTSSDKLKKARKKSKKADKKSNKKNKSKSSKKHKKSKPKKKRDKNKKDKNKKDKKSKKKSGRKNKSKNKRDKKKKGKKSKKKS